MICQTSYPFIWRHLSTKHVNEIAQIRQGSVSRAKIDLYAPTKTPYDQMMPKSSYECRICGKQMKHPGNLRQHEAACLRRQSLPLFEVSNEEQENVVTDPDLWALSSRLSAASQDRQGGTCGCPSGYFGIPPPPPPPP